LQPTRSIGDYYLKKEEHYVGTGQFKGPYLSCEPDVNEFLLTSAHRYIILASDGLWDVLSTNEVMRSLMNGREIDLNKTCYEEGEESPYVANTLECVLERCG
jgi:serine/threonine protein phosphatase PrpC